MQSPGFSVRRTERRSPDNMGYTASLRVHFKFSRNEAMRPRNVLR